MTIKPEAIEAFSSLNIAWARRNGPPGLSTEAVLVGMHKVRAESTDFPTELRYASLEWLRAHGYLLTGGRELPPPGELPV